MRREESMPTSADLRGHGTLIVRQRAQRERGASREANAGST
jgi:hypothetical protein